MVSSDRTRHPKRALCCIQRALSRTKRALRCIKRVLYSKDLMRHCVSRHPSDRTRHPTHKDHPKWAVFPCKYALYSINRELYSIQGKKIWYLLTRVVLSQISITQHVESGSNRTRARQKSRIFLKEPGIPKEPFLWIENYVLSKENNIGKTWCNVELGSNKTRARQKSSISSKEPCIESKEKTILSEENNISKIWFNVECRFNKKRARQESCTSSREPCERWGAGVEYHFQEI